MHMLTLYPEPSPLDLDTHGFVLKNSNGGNRDFGLGLRISHFPDIGILSGCSVQHHPTS